VNRRSGHRIISLLNGKKRQKDETTKGSGIMVERPGYSDGDSLRDPEGKIRHDHATCGIRGAIRRTEYDVFDIAVQVLPTRSDIVRQCGVFERSVNGRSSIFENICDSQINVRQSSLSVKLFPASIVWPQTHRQKCINVNDHHYHACLSREYAPVQHNDACC
jgi:hypothetical protein